MNISLPIFILVLALTGLLGIFCGVGIMHIKRSTHTLQHSSENAQLKEELLQLTGVTQQLRLENSSLQQQIRQESELALQLSPLQHKLEQVNQRVENLAHHSTKQAMQVLTQLQQDARTQAELRQVTAQLNTALHHSSTRGFWGEVQLRRIVELAGMLEHVDYTMQETLGDNTQSARPDLIIKLPGNTALAVDAKAPMQAYLQAQEITIEDAQSTLTQQSLLAEHAKALRKHIDTLAKRDYPQYFTSAPQYTVLFLPAEPLLSSALSIDAQLLEHALTQRVILTSPASLLALLRTIALLWSNQSANEEAQEIVQMARGLLKRFSSTIKHLHKLGNTLQSSVTTYNAVLGSLENNVLPQLRRFESLEITQSELHSPLTSAEIAGEKGNIREFVKPDFQNFISTPDDPTPSITS